MAYEINFAALSGSDWAEIVEAIDDDTNLPLDLTGILIELQVRDRCNAVLLQASTADSTIVIPETGKFQWVFPKEQMGGLCKGTTYQVGCRLTQDDQTTALFTGNLAYLDGEFQ